MERWVCRCIGPWLGAHGYCPQCRAPASAPAPLALTTLEQDSPPDYSTPRNVVLDLVHTQLEETIRENNLLKRKIENITKETVNEAKDLKLQIKFLQEKLADKTRNSTINRIKEENRFLGEELYRKCTELERYQCKEDESVYESIKSEKRGKNCCKKFSSCLRCSIVVLFGVALVVILTIVLPLKILFKDL